VRLTELVCLDDSDDLSDGEARFTLTVIDGAGETTRTVNWPEMPTGASLPIRDGSTDVVVNPPDAAGDVRVRVDCREDDSPADDDLASTSLTLTGGSALDFPVGPQERVDRRSITLGSRPLTVDNDLKFIARLMYSVGYR